MRATTIISVIFYLLCTMVTCFIAAVLIALRSQVPWWWFVLTGILIVVYIFGGACATLCLSKGLKVWPWNVMSVALKNKG